MDIVAVWLLSVGLTLVYYKSSVQKIRNPYAFQLIIRQYRLMGNEAAGYIAPLIAICELFAALWLLIPQVREWGIIVGIILQFIFMGALLANLGRTMDRGCGCFELNVPRTVTSKHLLINASILLALCAIWLIESGDIIWNF